MVVFESVNEEKEEILQNYKQYTCICIPAATVHCSVCVLTLFTVCYFIIIIVILLVIW